MKHYRIRFFSKNDLLSFGDNPTATLTSEGVEGFVYSLTFQTIHTFIDINDAYRLVNLFQRSNSPVDNYTVEEL